MHYEDTIAGKVVAITGANVGIGRSTAIALADRGAKLLLLGRSAERTRAVVSVIQKKHGQDAAQFVALDLSSFESIRRVGQTIRNLVPALHILINNAGVGSVQGMSSEGFELCFGVNHLGHFLLTHELMPLLLKSPSFRIVVLASAVHSRVEALKLDMVRRPASKQVFPEYSHSKLCNMLFVNELSKRLPQHGQVVAVHPGVVASDLWRGLPKAIQWIIKIFMKSEESGAKTSVHCAAASEIETGLYYANSKVAKTSKLARSREDAKTLWAQSEMWTGANHYWPISEA